MTYSVIQEADCFVMCRLFMEILNSCVDCDEIQFKEDGSWAPMISKKVVQEVSASSNGLEGMPC